MIEKLNNLLSENEVMVRIGSTWYVLDELCEIETDSFPIMVSDDNGELHEFDMADIEEFDPVFKNLDINNVGIA
jgi:hypothetical protein